MTDTLKLIFLRQWEDLGIDKDFIKMLVKKILAGIPQRSFSNRLRSLCNTSIRLPKVTNIESPPKKSSFRFVGKCLCRFFSDLKSEAVTVIKSKYLIKILGPLSQSSYSGHLTF